MELPAHSTRSVISHLPTLHISAMIPVMSGGYVANGDSRDGGRATGARGEGGGTRTTGGNGETWTRTGRFPGSFFSPRVSGEGGRANARRPSARRARRPSQAQSAIPFRLLLALLSSLLPAPRISISRLCSAWLLLERSLVSASVLCSSVSQLPVSPVSCVLSRF
ncbi:hypothetical protein VTN00DRAFT_1198 [Thermoascus crustaceus]|uniref:uncharacterized protein n=1 Tax=Thermoascus crustaceus TaxID=5088 RepID=UPI003742DC34